MMSSQQTLSVLLQVKDQMTPALGAAAASTDKLRDSMGRFVNQSKAAGEAMGEVGTQAKTVGTQVSAVGDHMDGLSGKQSKLMLKMGLMGTKMIAMNVAAAELGDAFGKGAFGKGIEHAISSVSKFATMAMLIPGPLGLAAGASLALLTVWKALSHAEDELTEKNKELTDSLREQRKEFLQGVGKRAAELALAKPEDRNIIEDRRGMATVEESLNQKYTEQTRLLAVRQELQRSFYNDYQKAGGKDDFEKFSSYNTLPKNAEDLRKVGEAIDALVKAHQALESELKKAEAWKKFVDDMGSLRQEVETLEEAFDQGILTPLQKSEELAKVAEKAMMELIKVKDQLDPEAFRQQMTEYKNTRDAYIASANEEKGMDEVVAIGKAKLKHEEEQLNREREKALQIAREHDPIVGLKLALDDAATGLMNFRHIYGDVIGGMTDAFANAFEGMISHANSWKEVMKSFANEIKHTFIKAFADMAAQSVMKNLLGGIGALMGSGGGGSTTVGGGSAVGRPSGMSSLAGGIGAGSVALGASEGGGGGPGGFVGGDFSAGNIMGGVAGTAAGVMGVMGSTSAGSGAVSGALGGAALGTMIFPGIGTAVGAVVGAIGGAIFGSRNKRRAKRAKARAEAAARAAQAAKDAEASKLFKAGVRLKMGGGLATPEAVDSISKLFSGDVTGDEIAAMGPGMADSILAQRGAIEQGVANKTINMGAPVINVSVGSIASTYDAQKLAEDLGFHLSGAIQSAGG